MKNHNSYIITFKKRWPKKKGKQVTQKKSDDAKSTIVTCKPDLNIYCKDFFSCQSNLQYFFTLNMFKNADITGADQK